MGLEGLGAVLVVCATVLALRVLGLRNQVAMRPTDGETAELRALITANKTSADAVAGAQKRQVDELARQLQHIDTRTRK